MTSALPASALTSKVLIRRIAPVMTFDNDDWYKEQRVDLIADVGYAVPISRQGVKVFPVQNTACTSSRARWRSRAALPVPTARSTSA